MKTARPYCEGTWFALPLREGGYATGLVARSSPKEGVILTYLFGPKLNSVPSLSEVEGLRAKNALKCVRVGDLGLMNGEWPIIGTAPHWVRSDWPMPLFIRREILSKRVWKVQYSDIDPSKIESEEQLQNEGPEMENASLCGYGSIEIKLTKLLANQ